MLLAAGVLEADASCVSQAVRGRIHKYFQNGAVSLCPAFRFSLQFQLSTLPDKCAIV